MHSTKYKKHTSGKQHFQTAGEKMKKMRIRDLATLLSFSSCNNQKVENTNTINKTEISKAYLKKQTETIDSLFEFHENLSTAKKGFHLKYLGLKTEDLFISNYDNSLLDHVDVGLRDSKSGYAYELTFRRRLNRIDIVNTKESEMLESEQIKKEREYLLRELTEQIKDLTNGYITRSSHSNKDALILSLDHLTKKEYKNYYLHYWNFDKLNPNLFKNGVFRQNVQELTKDVSQEMIKEVLEVLNKEFDEMHIAATYNNVSVNDLKKSHLSIKKLAFLLSIDGAIYLNLSTAELQKESINYFLNSLSEKDKPNMYVNDLGETVLEIPTSKNEFNYYIDKNNDGFANTGGSGEHCLWNTRLNESFICFLEGKKASMKKLKEYSDKGFLIPHELNEVYN